MHQILHGPAGVTLLFAYNLSKGSVFHAAYWFIPVALISVLLLIAFKKHINNLWLGMFLGVCALFYGVNLYHGWVSANHTQAFVGYVFFVWLGAQLKIHSEWIKPLLGNLPWPALLAISLILFAIACLEGMTLASIGCVDPYASLRISNAVLSIVVFLYLLKSHRFNWIRHLRPGQNTYGIYLIHSIVISELTPLVGRHIYKYHLQQHLPYLFLIQLLFFAIVLAISFIAVECLRRSPLRFVIGVKM